MTCKLFKDSMWQEPFPAYLQGAHAPISEMHPLETTVGYQPVSGTCMVQVQMMRYNLAK